MAFARAALLRRSLNRWAAGAKLSSISRHGTSSFPAAPSLRLTRALGTATDAATDDSLEEAWGKPAPQLETVEADGRRVVSVPGFSSEDACDDHNPDLDLFLDDVLTDDNMRRLHEPGMARWKWAKRFWEADRKKLWHEKYLAKIEKKLTDLMYHIEATSRAPVHPVTSGKGFVQYQGVYASDPYGLVHAKRCASGLWKDTRIPESAVWYRLPGMEILFGSAKLCRIEQIRRDLRRDNPTLVTKQQLRHAEAMHFIRHFRRHMRMQGRQTVHRPMVDGKEVSPCCIVAAQLFMDACPVDGEKCSAGAEIGAEKLRELFPDLKSIVLPELRDVLVLRDGVTCVPDHWPITARDYWPAQLGSEAPRDFKKRHHPEDIREVEIAEAEEEKSTDNRRSSEGAAADETGEDAAGAEGAGTGPDTDASGVSSSVPSTKKSAYGDDDFSAVSGGRSSAGQRVGGENVEIYSHATYVVSRSGGSYDFAADSTSGEDLDQRFEGEGWHAIDTSGKHYAVDESTISADMKWLYADKVDKPAGGDGASAISSFKTQSVPQPGHADYEYAEVDASTVEERDRLGNELDGLDITPSAGSILTRLLSVPLDDPNYSETVRVMARRHQKQLIEEAAKSEDSEYDPLYLWDGKDMATNPLFYDGGSTEDVLEHVDPMYVRDWDFMSKHACAPDDALTPYQHVNDTPAPDVFRSIEATGRRNDVEHGRYRIISSEGGDKYLVENVHDAADVRPVVSDLSKRGLQLGDEVDLMFDDSGVGQVFQPANPPNFEMTPLKAGTDEVSKFRYGNSAYHRALHAAIEDSTSSANADEDVASSGDGSAELLTREQLEERVADIAKRHYGRRRGRGKNSSVEIDMDPVLGMQNLILNKVWESGEENLQGLSGLDNYLDLEFKRRDIFSAVSQEQFEVMRLEQIDDEVESMMTPFMYQTQADEDREEVLSRMRRRGKGPPKKGSGKRAGRR